MFSIAQSSTSSPPPCCPFPSPLPPCSPEKIYEITMTNKPFPKLAYEQNVKSDQVNEFGFRLVPSPPSCRRPSPSRPPSSPPRASSPPPWAGRAWGCGGSSPGSHRWRAPSGHPRPGPIKIRAKKNSLVDVPRAKLNSIKL